MNNSQDSNSENSLSLSLLDGAIPDTLDILADIKQQKLIASSSQYSLDERLEAFEDILESQVGDTSITRARNIEREFGIRQLYLKFEGGNPTGTQKDRIAFAQVMDALRRGFDAITVATCGNYGVAIAFAAYLAGLKCYIYIPEDYHTKRNSEMLEFGAEIIRVPIDYENTVVLSKERAEKDEIYDANPGGDNTSTQLKAYGEIAYEIYDELRDAPACVSVPVSNGTTLAGIYKGFLSLYRRGKTSRIPKILAGSSFRKNPIIQAFLRKSLTCEDIQADYIRETRINEPLINRHSIDGDHALDAIRKSSGFAKDVSDKKMIYFSRLIREREGLNVLPASTAGLVVLIDKLRSEPFVNDRYVAILTGKK